jgi:hypothetical protein
MTTGILSIIFSLIFWFKDAVKLEKELGTVKYMLVFFMNTLCIQILYCLVTLLISLIIQNTILMRMKVTPNGIRNEGLWPILMCDLTLLCLNNPEEPMRLFLFPCIIKAKYYPLVLFLIFTILSGFNIDFEVLCAISFGFLYHFYLKNLLKITNNFAMKVENSFLCRWMKSKKGFVNTGGVTLPQLRNNLENVRNVVVNGNNANPQGGFRAFRGKGVAVGGGNTNNNTSANSDSNINSNSDSRNETTDDNNISVGSSGDLRSSDSRMDLNSSNPKS